MEDEMKIMVRYGEIGLKSDQVRKKFEQKLMENAQYLFDNFVGFHWVLVYGNWLEELKKVSELLDLDLKLPE